MKIKKNDTVLIISGKYRGKRGKVLRIFPKEMKILVEGINLVKKHRKPKKEGEKGEIVTLPTPINLSNAQLICPKCSKITRAGYKIVGNTKYRVCKKCNQAI